MREQLTISVDEGPGIRSLRLRGEVDMATAPQLQAALAETDGAARVWVEMWDLTFIDSSGFGVLVEAHQRLEEQGRRLVLSGVPPQGLIAMKVLGLDKVLHIDPGM